MTTTRTAEFDAFGPWVLEVGSARELPPLFQNVDVAGAGLVVKVPRQIERRYASPSMDLYDYLVVARDDSLTVLSREGTGYSTDVLSYDAIVLIEQSITLLDGRLRLAAADGTEFVLPFNAVSEVLITRLVDFIRSRVPPSSDHARFVVQKPPGRTDLGVQDVWLTGQFHHLIGVQPDLDYFGGYGRTRLVPTGGTLTRALYVARPAYLHGVVVCGRTDELQILSRAQWVIRTRGPVYSRSRTVIRPASVTSVSTREHPDFFDVSIVTVRLGSVTREYPVRSESSVESTLLALVSR